VIVTLDGYAGSGKSTVSRALAERLGYRLLDTGAMYRAVTLETIETGGDPVEIARGEAWRRHLEGEGIRSQAVNARVPEIAHLPEVRVAMREAQRAFLAQGDAVAEGRDIGAVVWPQAELKVWLDADPELRAARRVSETGDSAAAAALARRDRLDERQTERPDDAEVVDTTALAVDEVVDLLVDLVDRRRAVRG
jgi:cytidylate kinase